jgi:hypothetical protein
LTRLTTSGSAEVNGKFGAESEVLDVVQGTGGGVEHLPGGDELLDDLTVQQCYGMAAAGNG